MECPFTWDIDLNFVLNYDEDNEIKVDVEEQPVLALMNSIMNTYVKVIKKDFNGVEQNLCETKEIWDQIHDGYRKGEFNEMDDVSVNVLQHVMQTTEYHYYKLLNHEYTASKLINQIEDSMYFQSNMEISTLNGCKSIIWSSLHENGCNKAIIFAKKAISFYDSCALWYFILGKNLRRLRRQKNFTNLASTQETEAFTLCHRLSDNPFYEIFIAEICRQNKEYQKANEIYKKLYNKKISNAGVQLRLAKAFTNMKDFEKAESCFNAIEKDYSNNVMFLYYKGIFFQKQNKFPIAANYFKKAMQTGNYAANIEYAVLMFKMSNSFDIVQHFKTILEKFEYKPFYKQQILLHIAMQYYYAQNDIKNTIVHLLEAIEIDPHSNTLKKYCNFTFDRKQLNIFDLSIKLLNEFKETYGLISSTMLIKLEQLENICQEQMNG